MHASICGGLCACEPRHEASVTQEPHAGLHLSALCQHHLVQHRQHGLIPRVYPNCDCKMNSMPVLKKWVCRSSEASERSLASKQAELTLAHRALAALQDTSAHQSRYADCSALFYKYFPWFCAGALHLCLHMKARFCVHKADCAIVLLGRLYC